MAGFDSDVLFTYIKAKMNKQYPKCTVDRYKVPKESQMPYLDYNVEDRAGVGYSLSGSESGQNPLISLNVYCNGTNADSICEQISLLAKEDMLAKNFKCKFGPAKVNSTSSDISRWVARYQRIVCNGDEF